MIDIKSSTLPSKRVKAMALDERGGNVHGRKRARASVGYCRAADCTALIASMTETLLRGVITVI